MENINFVSNISDPALRIFENFIFKLDCSQKPSKFNLSNEEQVALTSLPNSKSIVINKIDKGGAIVILNHQDYHYEAMRLLY